MKFAALVFALLLVGTLAHADVIPPDVHYVPTCLRISNIGDYQDMQLIVETFSMNADDTAATHTSLELFGGDACAGNYAPPAQNALTKLHYVSKRYLDSVGGLAGIKLGSASAPIIDGQINIIRMGINDSNVHALQEVVPLRNTAGARDSDGVGYYVEQWKLTGSNGSFHLAGFELVKMKGSIPVLPGDAPPKPLPPNDTVQPPAPPAPMPEKAPNALEAFWCWLMGLFGQTCQSYRI